MASGLKASLEPTLTPRIVQDTSTPLTFSLLPQVELVLITADITPTVAAVTLRRFFVGIGL